MLYDWPTLWARPEQIEPSGDWLYWMVKAGRGFGKTRSGAEWVRANVEAGKAKRIALVARTAADIRDVVVEGPSGILVVSPPWFRPEYEPSKRRLTWPNGAVATTYTAERPDQLRGPEHDLAWADELAAWRYEDAWDQLMFSLRMGERPRVCITTTPRPTKLIKDLVSDPRTVVTGGTSKANLANLSEIFVSTVLAKYEGTTLGRQEINAEILEEVEGALWTMAMIEKYRLKRAPVEMRRIVIAIDPAATSGAHSAETGIIVAGLGSDKQGYVLDDVTLRASPARWGDAAITAYEKWGGDRIIGESNNGGEMVEHVIRTSSPNVPFKAIHASRGKRPRAEPVAALYEQGKIHHIGAFPELENQMTTWVPTETNQLSPDRMDALVWAFTELMVGGRGGWAQGPAA